MKIKRFFAPSVSEALSQVRESLGPEAIILSNRHVMNGFEILASLEDDLTQVIDESEKPATSLASQPTQTSISNLSASTNPDPVVKNLLEELREMRNFLANRLDDTATNHEQKPHHGNQALIFAELLALGFSASLARYMAANIPADLPADIDTCLQWAKAVLLHNLITVNTEQEMLDQGGIYALVGPTGVGKTTTTVNIAAALAMGGLHVLVVDLDPQGNASTALGIEHHNNEGIYEVLMGSANINSVVQKVAGFPRLECISSNTALAQAEINLVSMVARELRLKEALTDLIQTKSAMDQPYDYIFIDCPPSLGLLTVNALAAAQELLIPIQCEYYSLEGISLLMETLAKIKRALNPTVRVSTIVLTMFDSRTRLANDVANDVRAHFPNELIDIPIPRAVRVSEAPSFRQTVMTYDAASPGAIAYMQVAREIAIRGSAA